MPAIVIPAPISSNHAAPVSAGGTGAITAAAARTNLDVYSKSEVTNAISQSTANLLVGGPLKGVNIDTFNSWSHRGIYMYNGYTPSTDPSYVTGNVPFRDAWGLMFVIETGWGSIMQIVYNLTTGKIHRRLYQSGSWNAWTVST